LTRWDKSILLSLIGLLQTGTFFGGSDDDSN
jgi:hypothetical protein